MMCPGITNLLFIENANVSFVYLSVVKKVFGVKQFGMACTRPSLGIWGMKKWINKSATQSVIGNLSLSLSSKCSKLFNSMMRFFFINLVKNVGIYFILFFFNKHGETWYVMIAMDQLCEQWSNLDLKVDIWVWLIDSTRD